jgi:hypothetical protein
VHAAAVLHCDADLHSRGLPEALSALTWTFWLVAVQTSSGYFCSAE